MQNTRKRKLSSIEKSPPILLTFHHPKQTFSIRRDEMRRCGPRANLTLLRGDSSDPSTLLMDRFTRVSRWSIQTFVGLISVTSPSVPEISRVAAHDSELRSTSSFLGLSILNDLADVAHDIIANKANKRLAHVWDIAVRHGPGPGEGVYTALTVLCAGKYPWLAECFRSHVRNHKRRKWLRSRCATSAVKYDQLEFVCEQYRNPPRSLIIPAATLSPTGQVLPYLVKSGSGVRELAQPTALDSVLRSGSPAAASCLFGNVTQKEIQESMGRILASVPIASRTKQFWQTLLCNTVMACRSDIPCGVVPLSTRLIIWGDNQVAFTELLDSISTELTPSYVLQLVYTCITAARDDYLSILVDAMHVSGEDRGVEESSVLSSKLWWAERIGRSLSESKLNTEQMHSVCSSLVTIILLMNYHTAILLYRMISVTCNHGCDWDPKGCPISVFAFMTESILKVSNTHERHKLLNTMVSVARGELYPQKEQALRKRSGALLPPPLPNNSLPPCELFLPWKGLM